MASVYTICLFMSIFLLSAAPQVFCGVDICDQQFNNVMLNCHNRFRRKHGVPPLKIDNSLCSLAQGWANTLSSENKFYLNPNNLDKGENLFRGGGPGIDAERACKDWYNEIKDYTFGQPSPNNFKKVGHFTQVVWKDTTHLGCAKTISATGYTYIACYYNPEGNYPEQYDKNVLYPQ